MYVKTQLYRKVFQAVTSREPSPEVATSRLTEMKIKAAPIRACFKAATTLLSGFFLVFTAPQVTMTVTTEVITGIRRAEIRSNFITIDNEYVMTADGRIFFVMED